jgi:fibronectin type 3 domain-containing protein
MGKHLIYLGLILAMIAGCGRKAPPVPWEMVVPKRIVDLEALSREGQVVLEWTVPRENTDKAPLMDLAGFNILRSEGILVGGECRGCGEKAVVAYEMRVGAKEDIRGKKVSVVTEDHVPGRVYLYQVVAVNRRKNLNSPSNPAWVYWAEPPPPPQGLKGEGGDKRVDLTWDPVEEATGYHAYRRTEGETFPLNPVNREVLTATRFTDLTVENEKGYVYSVRAVKRVVKTDVEGKGSSEISITPTDLIPPAAPTRLVAVSVKGGIELNWLKNREPDLRGYFVYRRKVGEREFKRVNEVPLPKDTYLDTKVEEGQEYEYAVTAVDTSTRGNESPFSEEVRVRH